MDADAVFGNDGGHPSVHTAPVAAPPPDPDPGYASSRKIHHFPKHDTVKLNAHNFLLWKHQILLILEGYGLHEFVLGTIQVPPQSVLDSNGVPVTNPEFVFHKQQDKLLASWLLSTISDTILVRLTGASKSFDIWSAVIKRFASKSSLTVSSLRHTLFSQKKGQLTIQEYLAKVQSQCDILLAAGSSISEQEQITVILAGLPVEYDSIRVIASSMNFSLDYFTEMLTDCEARQQDLVSNMSLQANVAQHTESGGSRVK
ncbi:hypothetical protein Goshw_000339, partial [Gossypium schwendimanii]|nr:hypothetical protein [Gossypium schwendimanii]